MVGVLACRTPLIGPAWHFRVCRGVLWNSLRYELPGNYLRWLMRAPASRGQRDAGAVNPIRPGAVGQIGGSLRQGWSTWDRRSRPVGPSPETAITRVSRDQSGDVEGCSAADRGRSLPLRYPRRCVEAIPAFVPLSVTARSGEPLVPPPPEALPIMHDAVELSSGLVGIGDAGSPPRASMSAANAVARGFAAGAAGAQAGT